MLRFPLPAISNCERVSYIDNNDHIKVHQSHYFSFAPPAAEGAQQ